MRRAARKSAHGLARRRWREKAEREVAWARSTRALNAPVTTDERVGGSIRMGRARAVMSEIYGENVNAEMRIMAHQ